MNTWNSVIDSGEGGGAGGVQTAYNVSLHAIPDTPAAIFLSLLIKLPFFRRRPLLSPAPTAENLPELHLLSLQHLLESADLIEREHEKQKGHTF